MLGRLGYATAIAASGPEALRLQSDYRPDVVLLDLSLPEMPGHVIMQRLHQVDPALPVVVVTGDLDDELARRTRAQGAFECLAKPFRLQRLAEVLKAALGSRDA
jgi:two-component system C4-dicarboxylate transport response regulator DctD